MKKVPQFLLRCSVLAFAPVVANAAGTYYNNYSGSAQQQQQRYNAPAYSAQRGGTYGQSNGYNNYNYNNYSNGNAAYSSTRYNQNNRMVNQWPQGYGQNNARPASQENSSTTSAKGHKGFYMDAGLSYQMAEWNFEMGESGSILHYDNISWYVLDLAGGYKFDAGKVPMVVAAGLQYGFQGADSTMVDDDITNGGYLSTSWYDENDKFIGNQIGHAMSIGTTSGGSMLGFNLGVGLTDFWQWGNVRFTPSLGYRYFKYKLETKQNYGLAVDTSACFEINGEIQCDPAIILYNDSGKEYIIWRDDPNQKWDAVEGYNHFDPGSSYYFEQPGTSHSYEVSWSGPYLAMDMEYLINKNNSINGRVELGLPAYTSTGDQPYRFDWAHPKSVEDKAGFGDAYHFGLGANWMTAITDSVSLSLGLTYDYYTVGSADAKTYLNQKYYDDLYDYRLNAVWDGDETAMLDPKTGDDIALNIKQLQLECPGWVCSSNGEVDSFYKALGFRIGINALF